MKKQKKSTTSKTFFADNDKRIVRFGNYVLTKLEDEEIMDSLAQRDPEKLARILRILMDKSGKTEEEPSNRFAERLTEMFKNYDEGGSAHNE
jgi:hypothetical protein